MYTEPTGQFPRSRNTNFTMAPKKTIKRKARKAKKPVKKAPKKAKGAAKKKAPKSVKAKKVKVVKPKVIVKSVSPKGAYLSKSELLNNFMAQTELSRKQAKLCLDSLCSIGQSELSKGRKFVIPGMARFVVKKRPATKARQGTFFRNLFRIVFNCTTVSIRFHPFSF